MTAQTPGPMPGSSPAACECQRRAERAEAALAAVTARQSQARRHVREAVTAGNADLDIANYLLTLLDLEPLPRWWTVDVTAAVTITVPAASNDDANRTAAAIVEHLLGGTGRLNSCDIRAAGTALAGFVADDLDVQHTQQV